MWDLWPGLIMAPPSLRPVSPSFLDQLALFTFIIVSCKEISAKLYLVFLPKLDTEPPYGEDLQPGQGRPHPVLLPHVVRASDKNLLAKHSRPLFLVTLLARTARLRRDEEGVLAKDCGPVAIPIQCGPIPSSPLTISFTKSMA